MTPEQLLKLKEEALAELGQAGTPERLEQFRVKYLGRKGALHQITQALPSLALEDRRPIGRLANELKQLLAQAVERRSAELDQARQAAPSAIDLSLPGIAQPTGHLHVLTQVIEEIGEIFLSLGYRIVEGPELETDWYNFEALNIPKDHPSRDTFSTFYVDDQYLLRSQTSTVQIRVMEEARPPLAIIAPGKVFRPDAVDANHAFMFHQIEGLYVDRNVTFAQLKGTLALFCRRFFGPETKTRFRPHYFPFTEPSAEVDLQCTRCGGQGCRVCSQKGWLEILGAGLVHPNVFRAVKIDPRRWSGFAFGMGVERIAMLRYGINDIRHFFTNDLRFLHQF